MRFSFNWVVLALLLLGSFISKAQNYYTNGNAVRLNGTDCYRLTTATTFQNGSVWYSDQLDLNKDFKLEFSMNLGSNDAGGADGIVFVLQTVGTNALGQAGGGIGFEGFSPAFGIEFDTWQNTNVNDPSYDHAAFVTNGVINHNSSNNLAGPVQISLNSSNVEDGKDHIVTVTWDAIKKEVSMYFDCNLRLNKQVDLVKTIFNNKNVVYWGFTAATGGSYNNQTVCLRKDILIQDSFSICRGNSVQLSARQSLGNYYSWLPNKYIDNSGIQNPTVTPLNSGYYIVEYKNFCNQLVKDSIWIEVKPGPVFSLGPDTVLCSGTTITLSAGAANAKSYSWNDGSSASGKLINKGGVYWVKATENTCSFSDTIVITEIQTPKVNLGNDSFVCSNILITLTIQGNFNLLWDDNSTTNVRVITKPGTYWVTANNSCGTDSDTINFTFKPAPPLNLGNDTALCSGQKVILNASNTSIASYLWQNGSTDSVFNVTQTGLYYVKVTGKNGCFNHDSLKATYISPPAVYWPNDTVVCKNEVITITVNGQQAIFYWNNEPGDSSRILQNYRGVLNIKASNNCGNVDKDVRLDIKNCFCSVFYPNAITINDDNLNEVFKPVYDCIWVDYNLQIFNRWGEKLFETENPDKEWNGKYKNLLVPNGYYIWVVSYTALENAVPVIKTARGVVYVLR